ncbi:hypothetical protein PMIT1313_00094 [Prochlorococcus marinus str. MIT 1313]|uniref:NAD-dependent epimerase/dehydratase family protein n=1 Tax=Prochlorococcus TaxID=1218 RepID=UPI0007B3E936|nr:NAD-dependent epimerase/dehydratase family protein [Prochlorococcus marinus]KZR72354.1 hypothetical protein PMIT1313_00094 [Prochlorococcus marinus str. MIT 1313]KZR74053.1 hypothetical protein PMIT1318_00412 [Prochlorococcus marinus str. MIT 1318]
MSSSLPDNCIIVVTGATGWVGRTAVHELQRLLAPDNFLDRVRLFASSSGSILSTGYTDLAPFSIPVFSLKDLPDLAASESLSAVLHTAFLTRDRVEQVGLDDYVATNRWITAQVASALTASPHARAVVISSGAAAVHDQELGPDLASDPYGVLKWEEEQLLLSLLPTSLVLRLYALSGRFIREPGRFALGDFLLKALRQQPIRLASPNPVLRSYANASDITTFAWRWLFNNNVDNLSNILAATSCTTNLFDLAILITRLYDLPPVQSTVDQAALPNSYIAESEPFLTAMNEQNLLPMTMEQQVIDTFNGLSKSQLATEV